MFQYSFVLKSITCNIYLIEKETFSGKIEKLYELSLILKPQNPKTPKPHKVLICSVHNQKSKFIMRFAFYAAAAISAANAVQLKDEADDVFNLIQVAEQLSSLAQMQEDGELLGQVITEVQGQDFTDEEGNLA